MPIIRRNNCIYATLVWLSGMTVWYAGYIPDSHPHRITSTKCRKNTVVSPDDGPIVARNMLRLININILSINCVPSWFYLQGYTEMHEKIKKKRYSVSAEYRGVSAPYRFWAFWRRLKSETWHRIHLSIAWSVFWTSDRCSSTFCTQHMSIRLC